MALKDRMYELRVAQGDCGELHDKTLLVRRVAKVVKGGRRFGFGALVITGDGMGHVGFGLGKASEVPDAVRKASEAARKNLIRVVLKGSTVPHELVGKFGASSVIIKPAAPGTGVIAGSVARAVLEALGIKDVRTKCIGSSNSYNVLYATFDALTRFKDPERVAQLRGLSLNEMEYAPY